MVQISMIKILLEPSTGLATSNINAVSFEEDLPSVTRHQPSDQMVSRQAEGGTQNCSGVDFWLKFRE